MLSIESIKKVGQQDSSNATEINFRPGPASYVYMTCMAQVSAVCRELRAERAAKAGQ